MKSNDYPHTLTSISLNFSDGDKETINATCNTPNIVSRCIQASRYNETIYSICSGNPGYEVQRRRPGCKTHEYVANYRSGEYTWTTDYLYAKHFSFDKAIEHIERLYGRS